MTGATGRYLFAIARDLDAASLSGVSGLRGAPLEVVDHDQLQAVVCSVDLEEFGEGALARHLEEMPWLEEVARAHNDVVFAVAAHATTAPMRLVTICSDDASVRARIDALREQLVEALDRVHGRREWSVKVYAGSTREAPEEATPAESTGPATGGAGAAYLRRKKQQAEQRRSAGERSAQLAESVHAELSAASTAARRLQPQDPRLTGRSEPMLLNSAYLVEVDDGDAFAALVRRLGELHPTAQVELGGPWPPYSFATLETA